MSKPLLLWTADLHLERHAWVKKPLMRGDAYLAWRQVVELANEHSVPVVLGGDIFESNRPDVISLQQLFHGLRDCVAGRSYYIRGNHDATRDDAGGWAGLHPNASHLHKRLTLLPAEPESADPDNTVYGLDYTAPSLLPAELAAVPAAARILVCHQSWSEFVPRADAALKDIPDSICLVLTGDLHLHKHLVIERPCGPLVVLSPGSTSVQSTVEDQQKYVWLVHDDLSFRSLPLRGRKFVYATIRTPTQLEAALQEIERAAAAALEDPLLSADTSQPAWVVRYDGIVPDAAAKVQAKAAALGAHLFIEKICKEEPQEVNPVAGHPGLEEALEAYAEENKLSTAVTVDLLRLLRARNDPAGEVRALYGELERQYLGEQEASRGNRTREAPCGHPEGIS